MQYAYTIPGARDSGGRTAEKVAAGPKSARGKHASKEIMDMTTTASAAPAHVPEHLVKRFDFRTGLSSRPQEDIEKLLEGEPLFWSPTRHIMGKEGGAWVVTRADHIRQVMGNPEIFSNSLQIDTLKYVEEDTHVGPLASDPPDHARYRGLINPLFTPKKMFDLSPKIKAWCDELIDGFIDDKRCDVNAEFAERFPTGVFLDLMGFPRDRLSEFVGWTQMFIHGKSREENLEGTRQIAEFFGNVYARPDEQPMNSVVHYLLTEEPGGRKLTRGEFIGVTFLLFTAGLDTVVSALGFIFRMLAEDQDLQKRMREDMDNLPRYIEEMLRLASPVTLQRIAVQDTEIDGVTIKKGDILALGLAAASRDPNTFEDPDTFDETRNPNPHFAFGFGIHRCAGAQLARRDLIIALQQWFIRIPQFRLASDTTVTADGGSILSLDGVVVEWD